MKYNRIFIFIFFCLTAFSLHAQRKSVLNGVVYEQAKGAEKQALAGAAVFWLGRTTGIITGEDGSFSLPRAESGDDVLIIKSVSYRDDTIPVGDVYFLEWTLDEPLTLEEVSIRAESWGTYISSIQTQHVETISGEELGKAACCNLAESFTTNSGVDVQNTDAVSGSREIKLLGLAGRYTQTLSEKAPMIRGLGFLYGYNQVPGPWIESIQISKGAGTVENGYESITGEINIESVKPDRADPFFLNAYGNIFSRTELNSHYAHKFNSKLSTIVMGHASRNFIRLDNAGNGFLNFPIVNLYMGQNRWKYDAPGGLCLQASVKGIYHDIQGGQVSFHPETDKGTTNAYGIGVRIKRIEAYTKTGFAFQNREGRSFGIILSGFMHRQDSYFGLRNYSGDQDNFRGTFTWEDIILAGDNTHKYRAGAAFLYEDFLEALFDSAFFRTEIVPGIYGEYTYKRLDKFSVIAGLRGDYHNLFGVLFSPRIHLKYQPSHKTTLRFSAGKGYRTPNRVAENMQVLASSRQVQFLDPLQMESAWTIGLSLVQEFLFMKSEGSFVLEGYRTQFTNQLVIDLENPRSVTFYNLDGSSFSNVIQGETNLPVAENLKVKAALRWQQVQTTYGSGQKAVYFTPWLRSLLNVSWTPGNWEFDATGSWTASQRLPSTVGNPAEYKVEEYSPSFFMLNAQVTRKIGKRWEIYLGGENLLNFHQHHPVISPNDPFGTYFDSSIVWGPTMGTMAYIGFRFRIPKTMKDECKD